MPTPPAISVRCRLSGILDTELLGELTVELGGPRKDRRARRAAAVQVDRLLDGGLHLVAVREPSLVRAVAEADLFDGAFDFGCSIDHIVFEFIKNAEFTTKLKSNSFIIFFTDSTV